MIYLVLSAVCLALLYGVYRLALSRTTLHRFNRSLLLSIIGLSAILPAIRISGIGAIGDRPLLHVQNTVKDDAFSGSKVDSPQLPAEWSEEAFAEYAPIEEIEAPAERIDVKTSATTGVKIVEMLTQMDWITILTYLYLMGVAFFMIRLLIGVIRAETLCRLGGRKLIDGSVLLVCDGQFQPTSWRHTIIISRSDYESDNSRMIIEHEQAHIHHRHSIDVLLAQMVCALQWFNPAAWALKRSLQEVHEYEADAAVLADGFNEREYQICLVQAALNAKIGYVTSNFADCSTKKRITMMKTTRTSPWTRFRALLLLPAVSVIILLASACKPKAAQDASAQSEPAVESAPAPAAQPAAQSEPFDADAFLKKYPRPTNVYWADVFVHVEKDGAIWITVDGNWTYYPATLANFESEFDRIRKASTYENPHPDLVYIDYESPEQLEKCAKLVEILSKTYESDHIAVFSDKRSVPPPPMKSPEWGYNVNLDKDKYVAIQVNASNQIMYTAYNATPAGEPAQKKVVRTVDTDRELKADLEKLYPGAGSKVRYSVDYDRSSSTRLWRQMEKLVTDLKYTRADYNKGPANMTHKDSIDYIILGKDDGDGGRKRHVKDMKWYNDNKDKEEFFRMGFIDGQLCVCKGNDPSKLAPLAFDDLVPYFKANCPDGNERSAIVLLELPMDDESVPVEFLDKLLTKMEGWVTTFTRRLYVSPKHIE